MENETGPHKEGMARKRSLIRAGNPSGKPDKHRSRGRGAFAFLRSGEEGSALVEIALVTPILMTVVTGICAFAIGFNNQLTLTSAVGAGAQYLQLIRTSSTDPCADTLAAIEAAAPNLAPASISLSFSLDSVAVSGNSCPGDQVDLVQGQPVTVTAKYPCVLSIMSPGPAYGWNFTSNCQLSAKVTEYEY